MQPISITGCRYSNADGTAIDCVITVAVSEGVTEDWPFTATPDDFVATGRDIFARAATGEFGPIEPYVAPEPAPAPPIVLTARQFFIGLGLSGFLTMEEADAAATVGAIPPAIAAVFDALPAVDAFVARVTWVKMTEVPRDHPLVAAAAAAAGKTEAEVDAFFAQAALIP